MLGTRLQLGGTTRDERNAVQTPWSPGASPEADAEPMAILAALIAFGSRFASRILTTTLGWASTMLFGRVPGSRQILLLGITFGSVIWVVLLVGVIVPDVGAFLLLLVPPQSLVSNGVIRLLMLVGVVVAPAVIGAMTLLLAESGRRTARDIAEAVARGYPLTMLLSLLLLFLAGLAVWRKSVSLSRRWTDAHVPMVVKPGRYEQVARDIDAALSDAGLDLAPAAAPKSMSLPAKWLIAVAGRASSTLVPDRMVRLCGPDLDILIYPMDVLISGRSRDVIRSRAAIASRLTTSAAHLTVSAEAQAIEDRLATLAVGEGRDVPARFDAAVATELAAIDRELARIEIPYEEWEVLFRQRLQVERDLRAKVMAGEAVLGAGSPTEGPAEAMVTSISRLLRRGAAAFIDAATDDETIKALDKLAGPRWRLAAQAADTVVDALAAMEDRSAGRPDTVGEPLSPERTAQVPR